MKYTVKRLPASYVHSFYLMNFCSLVRLRGEDLEQLTLAEHQYDSDSANERREQFAVYVRICICMGRSRLIWNKARMLFACKVGGSVCIFSLFSVF